MLVYIWGQGPVVAHERRERRRQVVELQHPHVVNWELLLARAW